MEIKYSVMSISVNINFSVNGNISGNLSIFWRSSVTFVSDLHTFFFLELEKILVYFVFHHFREKLEIINAEF